MTGRSSKGLPAPTKPLKVAEPKDKEAQQAAFQAVLKELVLPGSENKGGKSKKAEGKSAEKTAEKSEGEA